mmetsp:Transcript_39745/g.93084  ORF Transcript_39745/g.93084 Transcript_39745/m.93084 type:complete len:239 (+) Transcript_39745:1669-2385(+)
MCAMATLVLTRNFGIVLNYFSPTAIHRLRFVPHHLSCRIVKVTTIDTEAGVTHLCHLAHSCDSCLMHGVDHGGTFHHRALNDPASIIVIYGHWRIKLNLTDKVMGSKVLDQFQYAVEGLGHRLFLVELDGITLQEDSEGVAEITLTLSCLLPYYLERNLSKVFKFRFLNLWERLIEKIGSVAEYRFRDVGGVAETSGDGLRTHFEPRSVGHYINCLRNLCAGLRNGMEHRDVEACAVQ